MSVKIRKVGTSNVLTVPNDIKAKSKKYDVFSGRNGAIIYLPVGENPFTNADFLSRHQFNGDQTGFIQDGSISK
ncbi:hypothetical protein WR164_14830 [Philodulcilactobacillus myokoensis]|uniref:Antitoxin of toxin-antitoxin stability system n=1 Tax=Philodulcilactobacillus myokoensis TaxID=2929573 RepID=A0A9W6B4Q9_9LACO|nr:antitoxin of toxin-antitoxin stability system [Philodulcilactobacillus myokoensis]GLB47504.1 hypothetical protein WR164_14830 [Philodulcilactobacillus myokoensis]